MIHALILFSLCFCHLLGVFVAETNGVKSLAAMEGDTLILESNVTEIQTCDEIEWTFGNIRIARIKRVSGIFSTSYEDDLRFIDSRLQLDNQTGSLTITNTRSVHTGVYDLTIMVRNVQSIKSYSVTVYALLPIPVIFIDMLPSSSSSERSSRIFLCSVLNASHVTLSWYKGNSLLSSISESDLSISLSLPLEVEYQDKNTYSCVLNNPISNQTQHLDITDFYLSSGVVGVETNEVKSVSVKKGDSIILHCDVNGIHTYDEIEWSFVELRIARIKKAIRNDPLYDNDERFRDRLKLDQTGSLTITNTRITDSGLYQLTITIKNQETIKKFNVNVYARLPVPVISRNSSHCSSSSSSQQNCSLVCSVVNVSHVTLSWYKGNSLLSSISVSDLSISLSLPLEVEYQEKNTYSCVLNNPISNETTHLDISKLCHTCADSVHYCGTAEVVIRLVVSALMGVAAVAAIVVLVYDIKSRTGEKRTDINLRQRSIRN
ncbi:hemicentin-2-like [Sinocyclocheilus grahami]|uniref:hemicentin-2-like n=1 Tax=Sinocyclocheilus grahami TaxID=75366 RepID=UPI0007AD201C|nr:PREDICTED: hemicentin-2-like [Sinocyclocheilus grahami]